MKTSSQFLATLGALCLLSRLNVAAGAQPAWQTVADFPCAGPAAVDALAKDAAGNLFAAISTADAQGRMHAVIRKSSDHGTTWSVVEDYLYRDKFSVRFLSMGADVAGHLYAAGYAESTNGQIRWIVRRSDLGGNVWSTVDDFTLSDGGKTVAQGVAVDAAGNLYVAGHASELPSAGDVATGARWVVRGSRDGGRTWSTMDDFNNGFSAKAFAILSTSNGLFVAGAAWDGELESGDCWLVRKGTPDGAGGLRWQVVDEFVARKPGQRAEARPSALGVDARGHLYAVGRSCASSSGPTRAHWTVRCASEDGLQWREVDAFRLESDCFAAAWGIAANRGGDVFVVGQAADGDNGIHWIVRRSRTGETGTWSVCDDFQKASPLTKFAATPSLKGEVEGTVMTLSPGHHAKGVSILSESESVFAGGGSACAGPGHAVVRKLKLPPAGQLTAAGGGMP